MNVQGKGSTEVSQIIVPVNPEASGESSSVSSSQNVAWPMTTMFFRSSTECGRKSRKTSGNFLFKHSEQKLSSCFCWPP